MKPPWERGPLCLAKPSVTGAPPIMTLTLPRSGFSERADRVLHVRYGGGQRRGRGDGLWLVLDDGLDRLFGRNVGARVNDFEASALEHHGDSYDIYP